MPNSPIKIDSSMAFLSLSAMLGRRRPLHPLPPLVVGFNVCFYPGGCRLVLHRCSTAISPSIPHRHRIGFVEFVLVRVPRCSASVGPCILRPRSSSDWMSLNLYPGGCRLFVSFGKSDGWFIIARSQKSVVVGRVTNLDRSRAAVRRFNSFL